MCNIYYVYISSTLLNRYEIILNNIFIIKGDIEDEDEVLAWLTDEDTLEIPGKIEEVNARMLEKILEENDHVVVFFCK